MSNPFAVKHLLKSARASFLDEHIFKIIANAQMDFEFTHSRPGPGQKVKVVPESHLYSTNALFGFTECLNSKVVIAYQEVQDSLRRLSIAGRILSVSPHLRGDSNTYLYVNAHYVEPPVDKEKESKDLYVAASAINDLEDRLKKVEQELLKKFFE